ncbi:MAG: ABC transporter substrate-binding protein [Acidimicrobiales bacterium]|nr:ABC transporter substrate-binding protein [Acidimicrobiales bacterium]
MRSTRSSVVARVLACSLLILVGCSEAEGADPEPELGVESGLPADVEPRRGGRLVYGLEAESNDGFCLSSATLAMSGLQVVRSIYDHLTIPDGKGGYLPYLAESVTSDDSFKVWTIKLRPGIEFHDGNPLDAATVKANLDAFRGAEGDHARQSLLFAFSLKNIDTVEVVNELTVRVRTVEPQRAFPGILYSSGRLAMMSPTQLHASEEDCATKPSGTGPFEFVRWEPGESMVLRRNPDYWQEAPDGQPYPYLDSIEYRPIPNNDRRIAALREGDINMMITSAAKDMVTSLSELRDAGDINLLISTTQTEVTYGILNTSRPNLAIRELRVAAVQAIDFERLNDIGNAGFPEIAQGPFGEGVLGHLEDNGYPEYDPEAAKATVEQFKEDGVSTSFSFLSPDSPSNLRLAVLVQSMLNDVGFDVTLEVVSEAELIDRVIAGEFDVASFRNHPGEDPDLNYVWWYGTSPENVNPVNFGRFDDPIINENLDIGRSSGDDAERKAAYEAVNRQFGKEVWNVWIYYAPWAVAEAENVHGILGPDTPSGDPATSRIVNGHPTLGIWIDEPRG